MQNRKALCLSLLDRSFAAVDPTDNFHIEFRLSAIGIKTVHFLLYIIQLGVAEAEHLRIVQKHIRQPLITCKELFLGSGSVAVAPAVLIHALNIPLDAAVLADEYRDTDNLFLSRRMVIPCQDAVLCIALIMTCELFRVLLVVVQIVNISNNMEIAAGIDAGSVVS